MKRDTWVVLAIIALSAYAGYRLAGGHKDQVADPAPQFVAPPIRDNGLNRASGTLSLASPDERGLVAHYEFDGNLVDAATQLVASSTNPKFGEDRFGRPHASLALDGVGEYVDLGPAEGLRLSFPLTFSAWVKRSDFRNEVLIANNDALHAYTGFFLGINSDGLTVFSYGDGGPAGYQYRRTRRGRTVIEPNKWYFIVGVASAPNKMEIFVNGRHDSGAYDGSGGPLVYGSGRATIGYSSTLRERAFYRGLLDDIRIYNVALTADQVAELYNAGSDELATTPQPAARPMSPRPPDELAREVRSRAEQ